MREIPIFAAVGIVSTLVHAMVGTFVIRFVAEQATVSNIIGYCVALFVSYFGHSLFTFRKKIRLLHFLKFVMNNTTIFAVSVLVTWILDSQDVNAYLSLFVVVSIFPIVSFILHKYHSFR